MGTSIRRRTAARSSIEATGCSTSSRSYGDILAMAATAASTSQAPLASTRMATEEPTAARTAATRSMSPASPTFTFTVEHPPASASAAASSGPTAGTRLLTATVRRTAAGHPIVAASFAAALAINGSHG